MSDRKIMKFLHCEVEIDFCLDCKFRYSWMNTYVCMYVFIDLQEWIAKGSRMILTFTTNLSIAKLHTFLPMANATISSRTMKHANSMKWIARWSSPKRSVPRSSFRPRRVPFVIKSTFANLADVWNVISTIQRKILNVSWMRLTERNWLKKYLKIALFQNG